MRGARTRNGRTARQHAPSARRLPPPAAGPYDGPAAVAYETAAGSAGLGRAPVSSSSPMAIPRRLDT